MEAQHFTRRATVPSEWQQASVSFLAAANYVLESEIGGRLPEAFPGDFSWRSGGSVQPLLLLYGAAVENLLKAVRVAQGCPAIQAGKLNGYFLSHNLQRYARDAGLSLSTREEAILVKLEDVLVAGKYPVAKNPQVNDYAWSFDYPADIIAIWEFLERTEEALRITGADCMTGLDLRTLSLPHP